jgi:hypothetical protein
MDPFICGFYHFEGIKKLISEIYRERIHKIEDLIPCDHESLD